MAGRYRLLEKVGSGGAGEVYRAVDDRTQSTVAIKFLRAGLAPDLEHTSRLFEGAWAASLIHNQYIVHVHETGLSEFGPFIVMEDLHGDNARRLLERHGRLKKEHCFAIIEPVLLALGAAHAIGLLHADLKPENVVVCQLPDHSVTVKLLDFGAAVSTGRQFLGSSEYLSPEQIEGGPIDHRSDLFSVCVLLFELLTNSLPFHGPTAASTTHRIVNSPCPTLEQTGLLHLEGLSEVLLRGLEKAPARRHSNARELLEALRPLMQGDTPAESLLSDLLPLAALMRQESGTMPASATVSQRSRATSSMPSPESGARLATALARQSLVPTASRSDATPASNPPEREGLGAVLPARYRGRFRVRAIVWQALDEYVRSRRPANLRERILYDIGGDDASDLLLGTLQGIVYCELESLTQYITLATTRLFSDDHQWCRAAGREAVDGVLSAALTRSIPPTPNVTLTLRRTCRILGPLFDFGEWQAAQHDQAARMSISGIDAMCQGLRLWVVGVVERSLAVAHHRTTLTITRGDGSFMPKMVLDVADD